MPVPQDVQLAFKGWVAWSDLFTKKLKRRPLTDGHPFTESDLDTVGSYLLARFPTPEEARAAIPEAADRHVFYIGETHGATTSLAGRLKGFGKSAGFAGTQAKGHYAGWWYPWRFPETRAFDAVRTSTAELYVAIQPYPYPAAYTAARGAFPLIIEGKAIWRHVSICGELPALNNKGRSGTAARAPLPRVAVDALMSWRDARNRGDQAASWIARFMAISVGTKVWEAKPRPKQMNDGRPRVCIQPGKKKHGYFGLCLGADGRGVVLEGHAPGEPSFQSACCNSYPDLQRAWEDLWTWWWT